MQTRTGALMESTLTPAAEPRRRLCQLVASTDLLPLGVLVESWLDGRLPAQALMEELDWLLRDGWAELVDDEQGLCLQFRSDPAAQPLKSCGMSGGDMAQVAAIVASLQPPDTARAPAASPKLLRMPVRQAAQPWRYQRRQ